MSPEVKYERIGKFIYGAHRYGGDMADVYNWMADALGLPRPIDEAAQASTLDAYLSEYASDNQFDDNHQSFIEMMKRRSAR